MTDIISFASLSSGAGGSPEASSDFLVVDDELHNEEERSISPSPLNGVSSTLCIAKESPTIVVKEDDHVEWPTLHSAHRPKTSTKLVSSEYNRDKNDWEFSNDKADDATMRTLASIENDETHIVVVELSDLQETSEGADAVDRREPLPHGRSPARRSLRHSLSSPIFGSVREIDIDEDSSGDGDDFFLDDSFDVVSRPGSVLSAWTTSSPAKLSFRDAILSKSVSSEDISKTEDDSATGPQQLRRKGNMQPKFVVTSLRRNVHSTGDLPSLGRICEERSKGSHQKSDIQSDDDLYPGSGASPLSCDTMEFYNRKILGAQSRKNGLKLRPDEAKRKQMIMYKKSLQKQRK
jgi:hypothetical protein